MTKSDAMRASRSIDAVGLPTLMSDAPEAENPELSGGESQGPHPAAQGGSIPKIVVVDPRYWSGASQPDTGSSRRPRTATRAIKRHCLMCCGNRPLLVQFCPSVDCFLWDFRFGCRPRIALKRLGEDGKDLLDRACFGDGRKFDPSMSLKELRKSRSAEKFPFKEGGIEPSGREPALGSGLSDALSSSPRADASTARE